MTDSDSDSLKKPAPPPSNTTSNSADSLKKPSPPANTTATSPTTKPSWRDKFRTRKEERGKEPWRDASLSEQDRWKDWQKAKDKEQAKGSTTGFFIENYKKKGSWGYWLDMFF